MATVLELLRARRSIRRLRPDPIDRERIARLLEAAVRAPSNHNCQPWHFVVVETPKAKRALAVAMGEAWRRDLARAGTDPQIAERLVTASIERFSNAPLLLLGCLDERRLPDVPEFLREQERLMGIHSVAMALYGLQLAAVGEGLASCWYCAPLYCPEVVVEVLELPATLRPQALLVVGYPASPGRERRRLPWAAVTSFR